MQVTGKTSLQIRHAFFLLTVLLGALSPQAQANTFTLPQSLGAEIISEAIPTAFEVSPFETEDFILEWQGPSVEGVEASLISGSLEWSRIADVLVLPRAKLKLTAKKIQAGKVANNQITQPLSIENGDGTAELIVPLISGPRNSIEVTIQRAGREAKGKLLIRFKPRNPETLQRVNIDASCSPYQVHVDAAQMGKNEWMYVGCRMVSARGERTRSGQLDLYVYWDNIGDTLHVDGVETPSQLSSLWTIRARSKPGKMKLQTPNGRAVDFSFYVPNPYRRISLGLGLGPYQYTLLNTGQNVQTVAPLMTLYSSFFFTESTRLIAFDATPLHRRFFTDFGIYLSNESIRTFDNRLSINLLLGMHVIAFRINGDMTVKPGAPQGFEFIFRDAFKRSYNMTAGAFIYPLINDKSYYNLWLRWGTRGYFAELNYLSWQEAADRTRVYQRSVGFCLGFPIAQFF